MVYADHIQRPGTVGGVSLGFRQGLQMMSNAPGEPQCPMGPDDLDLEQHLHLPTPSSNLCHLPHAAEGLNNELSAVAAHDNCMHLYPKAQPLCV